MCVTCSQLAKQVIASLWPYLRKHTQRHTSAYFETQEENAHIYHSVVFPHFQRENTHTYLHTQLLYIRLSHPDDTLHKLSEAVKHTYAQMQSQGKERKCRLYYVIRHTQTPKHTQRHTGLSREWASFTTTNPIKGKTRNWVYCHTHTYT